MTTLATPAKFRFLSDIIRHLGGIPPDRILFDPIPGTATKDDLIRVSELGDGIYELIDGTLMRKPVGYGEGYLGGIFFELLSVFTWAQRLGHVIGEATQLEYFGGQFMAADVAYISFDRLPGRTRPTEPIPALAPNLIVEVLSPGNTAAEMRRKRQEYFRSGVEVVWEVEPDLRIVNIYSDVDVFETFTRTDTISADPVVPGFTLSLPDLFARWDYQA